MKYFENIVNGDSPKEKVVAVLQQIPTGKITTYGSISRLTGVNSRQVGWILSGFSETEMEKYPWQRVVAKHGIISSLKLGPRGMLQIELLKKEGFQINDNLVIDFMDFFDQNESLI